MDQESNMGEEFNQTVCENRRKFIVKATAIIGGIVLSLSDLKIADAQTGKTKSKNPDLRANEFILKLDEKSPLNEIGGYDTIETAAGKIIIVRSGELDFSAYSAVCTHKGGPIAYDAKTRQLFCPWHDSRFDIKGQVIKGLAKQPLKIFATQKAISITLKQLK